ncbi:ATP synthase F0 subcomplex A subunit [Frondihabitans sp. PhB188]|uniref:F0F1 ATP synthase subunit A n=1 Tax=Frondihabitans sp. PhB188 TaxID=2485200 RepID=UPI000FA592A1|nr:ATP synthase F0 subcomplex A subunit [Frondihabitans sp. PhB188]
MHPLAAASDSTGGFQGPSIDEFFPSVLLFDGTPFEINRIMLARFFAVIVLFLVFWLGTRKMKLVPGRFQSIVEMGLDLVRVNIAEDLLGKKDGKRFLPILTTVFFMVLFMNLTGIIPGFNIAGTSLIGIPLILAAVAYVVFIYAGIRKHPGAFFKNALVPPGVPWPLYIIVTPIELVSTFVLRPVTLTLRLLMNMIVGHLLLVLFFTATSFFLFESGNLFALFGIGTIAFGFVFTLFEILVAVLQAYVFSLLTAVYAQLALNDEH